MAFTLYDAIIPSNLQMLGGLAALIDKAEAWCKERAVAPDDLIQARLTSDMLPFAYQVKSAAVHSLGAIEGVRKGIFSPDMETPPGDFAGLKAKIVHASDGLKAVQPSELAGFMGRDVEFVFGERKMPFICENFLLSFSQPNFYFHVTTAYDILRSKGLPLGKRDYIGQLRVKI